METKRLKEIRRIYEAQVEHRNRSITLNKLDFKELLEEAEKANIEDKGDISDGSHTFKELYYHRMILFSVVCNANPLRAWKSWKHHDGTMYDDYFIVGIETIAGQYTYHYHKDDWDKFRVRVLENAPEWDGHQPEDVTRLLTLV